jgi:two-component system response regulator NreC
MSAAESVAPMPDPIRVLIVDDHTLVRSGLRLLLEAEDGFVIDDEAGDAEAAVRLARLHKPDVILLDVVLPGRSGIEAAPEILEAAPHTRILILSMQDDPSYVRQAFSAGASGYLLKEAADDELVQAVREVAGGGRYVHPALGARLAAAEAEAKARAEADPLSDREREVLRLLALGHTNQEIAKLLFGRLRPTGRTSCKSSASRPARSSCGTRSVKGSSSPKRPRRRQAAFPHAEAASLPTRRVGSAPRMGA